PERDQAELVLPPQAVGAKLFDHVENHEIVAELLLGRGLVEVLGVSFAPMKRETFFADEGEGVVDALLWDPAAAIDDPRLVDLVLGETVEVQEPRTEVAVDHAHRRVAEHEREDSTAANLGGDLGGHRGRRRSYRR